MIFTEAAIFRTAVFHFSREQVRHGAWLRVRERLDVVLRVARDFDFEETMSRAFLLHPHFVIAQDDVRVDQLFAGGTDRSSVRKERGIAVPLWRRTCEEWVELDHYSLSFGTLELSGDEDARILVHFEKFE